MNGGDDDVDGDHDDDHILLFQSQGVPVASVIGWPPGMPVA